MSTVKYRKDKVRINCLRLKELRKEKGVLQRQLGKKVGFTHQGISNLETKQKTVHTKSLKRIAKALGMTLDEFVERKISSLIPVPVQKRKRSRVRKRKLRKEGKQKPPAKVLKENVFKHEDISEYIQSLHTRNKKKYGSDFSYEFFSRKLGFISKSMIYKVITGEKAASDNIVNKLVSLLDLSIKEAMYLILLQHFSKTKIEEKEKKN